VTSGGRASVEGTHKLCDSSDSSDNLCWHEFWQVQRESPSECSAKYPRAPSTALAFFAAVGYDGRLKPPRPGVTGGRVAAARVFVRVHFREQDGGNCGA
jgi:hypothetical protein